MKQHRIAMAVCPCGYLADLNEIESFPVRKDSISNLHFYGCPECGEDPTVFQYLIGEIEDNKEYNKKTAITLGGKLADLKNGLKQLESEGTVAIERFSLTREVIEEPPMDIDTYWKEYKPALEVIVDIKFRYRV